MLICKCAAYKIYVQIMYLCKRFRVFMRVIFVVCVPVFVAWKSVRSTLRSPSANVKDAKECFGDGIQMPFQIGCPTIVNRHQNDSCSAPG